jgi:sterol desaturase/sphingolipid hydroxylase (fatty acid hydroxylase superfamily)
MIFGIGQLVERMAGAQLRWRNMMLSFEHWLVTSGANLALMPLAATAAATVITALGGGLLSLPGEGWGLLWALPVFVLAMELADYLFHRAQHAWPFLWALHSLHHSDAALGVTTSVRLPWAESLIRAVFVYPLVIILIKPSLLIFGIYNLMTFWGYLNHMNLRLSFGRFQTILTSPQYHRIHHAADERLANRNFAAMFPVIDVIFGTYYAPKPGEYPVSGLTSGKEPAGLLDIALWPIVIRPRVGSRGAALISNAAQQ